MGMLCHGCLAAVLLKNREPLVFETDLDNELELTLDVNEDYFRGVKSIGELKTAISNAFISEEYPEYDFESVIEDLGDISSYEWLMEKLDECGMEDISGIVLMTDTDGDTRVYRWYKYALSPYSCTSGSFERESNVSASREWYLNEEKILLPEESNGEKAGDTSVEESGEKEEKAEGKVSQGEETEFGITFEELGKGFEYFVRTEDVSIFGMYYPKGVTIKNYIGQEKDVVIPAYVESYPVNVIAGIHDNDTMESVTIPDTVDRIGNDAFQNCSALKKIKGLEGRAYTENWREMQPGELEISKGAFSGCEKLLQNGYLVVHGVLLDCDTTATELIPPAGTKWIHRDLFSESDGKNQTLETVILPEGLKGIGTNAFSGCSSLKNVVFPSTLEVIEAGAIRECKNLRSVRLPDSLKIIREGAFGDCSELSELVIPEHTAVETAAFSGCSKLTREDGLVVVNGAFFDIDWKKHERYRQSLDFLPEPPEDDGFFQDIVYLPEDVKQIQSSMIGAFMLFGGRMDQLIMTDSMEYINCDSFSCSGIGELIIISKETKEIIFSTKKFKKGGAHSFTRDSKQFIEFCEKFNAKKYREIGIKKGFGMS